MGRTKTRDVQIKDKLKGKTLKDIFDGLISFEQQILPDDSKEEKRKIEERWKKLIIEDGWKKLKGSNEIQRRSQISTAGGVGPARKAGRSGPT